MEQQHKSYETTVDIVHSSLVDIFQKLGHLSIAPRYAGKMEPLPSNPDLYSVNIRVVVGGVLPSYILYKFLQPEEIVSIYQSLGGKFGFLAKQRIFHGDSNDENVLLRIADKEPIIIDWDKARLLETSQQVEEMEMSTPPIYSDNRTPIYHNSTSLVKRVPVHLERAGYEDWADISRSVEQVYWEAFYQEFNSDSSLYMGRPVEEIIAEHIANS